MQHSTSFTLRIGAGTARGAGGAVAPPTVIGAGSNTSGSPNFSVDLIVQSIYCYKNAYCMKLYFGFDCLDIFC